MISLACFRVFRGISGYFRDNGSVNHGCQDKHITCSVRKWTAQTANRAVRRRCRDSFILCLERIQLTVLSIFQTRQCLQTSFIERSKWLTCNGSHFGIKVSFVVTDRPTDVRWAKIEMNKIHRCPIETPTWRKIHLHSDSTRPAQLNCYGYSCSSILRRQQD